ncbi:YycH family regulatory protein [Pseudalkalibacillus sp. SCS-8]|uniref:YycH family regulatory protein n=1 Tax=Pseudalkalibacillus nanhaiensis TaxID=3115291 RepID=UPI0032DBBE99
MVGKHILRQLKKFYSSIWDRIELIKSVLLSLLIILSMFLTWSLWTYTPNINVLENQEPFKTAIENGDKKNLGEMIQPKQIILHKGDKHYWSYFKDQEEVYKQLQETLLIQGEEVEYKPSTPDEGIEIFYPTEIPGEVLRETFSFGNGNDNPFRNSTRNIEKIKVFKEEGIWKVQFIGKDRENEKQMKSAKVVQFQLPRQSSNIPNLIDKMIGSENTQEVALYEIQKKAYYLPVNEMTVQSSIFTSDTVEIDLFVRALLQEDVAVRKRDDKILYGDPTSLITYEEDNETFSYRNLKTQDGGLQQNAIIQSLDFINRHEGWTDNFNLYHYYDSRLDLDTNNKQKEIRYRMIVDGFPVMDDPANNASISEIEIEWTKSQPNKYERSLRYLKDPYGDFTEKVASGNAVIKALERMKVSTITDITLGYKAVQIDSNFELLPTWYYRGVSSWMEIDFEANEPPIDKGA